jgi:hypothetical protein
MAEAEKEGETVSMGTASEISKYFLRNTANKTPAVKRPDSVICAQVPSPEDSYGARRESVRSSDSFILPALRVKASVTYRTGG